MNSTGTTNPRRGSHGERLIGAQPFDMLENAEPIMSCDTNFDRRVDKAEFDQCAARGVGLKTENDRALQTIREIVPRGVAGGILGIAGAVAGEKNRGRSGKGDEPQQTRGEQPHPAGPPGLA